MPPGEGEEQDSVPQRCPLSALCSPLSALNEFIEIPTLREVLCSLERREAKRRWNGRVDSQVRHGDARAGGQARRAAYNALENGAR